MSAAGGRGRHPARQLALELARAPSYAADEFLVSPGNEAAHDAVMRWPAWPDPVLLLVGPAGSGKSHLAAIWEERAKARRLDAAAVAAEAAIDEPLVLEDCDRHPPDEGAFFHFLNALRGTRGSLLMTARVEPGLWSIRTPDLLSRLRLSPVATIASPDSALIRAVIVKLFADRQIAIEEDVVNYAARHCEQSFAAVNRFVKLADETAMAAGRRITRPLAASIVSELGFEDGNQGPI